jgi:hypothetical protein
MNVFDTHRDFCSGLHAAAQRRCVFSAAVASSIARNWKYRAMHWLVGPKVRHEPFVTFDTSIANRSPDEQTGPHFHFMNNAQIKKCSSPSVAAAGLCVLSRAAAAMSGLPRGTHAGFENPHVPGKLHPTP